MKPITPEEIYDRETMLRQAALQAAIPDAPDGSPSFEIQAKWAVRMLIRIVAELQLKVERLEHVEASPDAKAVALSDLVVAERSDERRKVLEEAVVIARGFAIMQRAGGKEEQAAGVTDFAKLLEIKIRHLIA